MDPPHSDPPSPLPLEEFMDPVTDIATSCYRNSNSVPPHLPHSVPPSPLPLEEFMDTSTGTLTSHWDSLHSASRVEKGSINDAPSNDGLGDQILMWSHRKLFNVGGRRQSSLYASQEPGVGWSRNILNLFATEIWFKRYNNFWKNPLVEWSFVDMPHASLRLCKPRKVNPHDVSFERLTAMLIHNAATTVRTNLYTHPSMPTSHNPQPEEDLQIVDYKEQSSRNIPQFPACARETEDMAPNEVSIRSTWLIW